MTLFNYLHDYFYSLDQLAQSVHIGVDSIRAYQNKKMVPLPSYQLNGEYEVSSFLGIHQDTQRIEFYPKDTVSWLRIIQDLHTSEMAFDAFVCRYQLTVSCLKKLNNLHNKDYLHTVMLSENKLREEWNNFLSGSYGVSTRSGLPEDIAAKDFALEEIRSLLDLDNGVLTLHQIRNRLENAVNLLDEVSAPFAPHERERSTRHQYVDEIRRQYRLELPL